MSHAKYTALKVVQQPGAPVFYLTAAPARELLRWCDVPRTKGDYMAGYQRALSGPRGAALTKYLSMAPQNIIPGAIIVAVDADQLTITESGSLVELSVKEDTREFKTKLEELFGGFTSRLSNDELDSADIEFSASDWDGREEDDDDENPKSYLALLTKELKTALSEWDRLPTDRQSAIREYIDGVSKPGLIIDGQHRVFGAAKVEHDVLLPVVLIPGLEYSEQVFQFYVLNSRAKPLRPTELRRIVSTTLTNQEIQQLYTRFKQVGVTPEEARWTYEMNTRPDSPFQNRIDFGFGKAGEIIPENVAAQVVRAFMKLPAARYRQLTAPLGVQWQDLESRLDIFFWFWNAVKTAYSGAWADAQRLADAGEQHNLFLKVSLLTLQKFLLDRFLVALPYRGTQPPPLSSKTEIDQMVKITLANLPDEFFQREWKAKQMDTSEGRDELYGYMETIWNRQGEIHGNMKLFKG